MRLMSSSGAFFKLEGYIEFIERNSLLPAEMHIEKHLITASYISPEMQALNQRYTAILNVYSP